MNDSQSSIEWYSAIEPSRTEEIKLDFAVSLEKAAREIGATKADIARQTGVSAARISKALRGDSNLTIETMEKLAEAVRKTVRIYLANRDSDVFHFETVHIDDKQIEIEMDVIKPVSAGHHFPVSFGSVYENKIITVLE